MLARLRSYRLPPLVWLGLSVAVLAILFVFASGAGYVLQLVAVWLVTP